MADGSLFPAQGLLPALRDVGNLTAGEGEQPPLPIARSYSGTDLVSPIRHRKGEGIRVLFHVTGVDVLDAARGQVCLAEGTNSCPWKTNNRGEMCNRKSKAGKNFRKQDIFSCKNSVLVGSDPSQAAP